ncbi:flavin reductase family protein [Streptomyces sp. NPDC000229]|uniref:flavin reductase family protein n=1 Tax=Streptomyces sp. NPDC000229 TaxID=3154247 RepID=UPI003322E699
MRAGVQNATGEPERLPAAPAVPRPRQARDLTDTGAFRDFMGSYFTGVSIVTALDGEGRPHGLTCSSLTSVTLAPPTLQVCLDVRSGTLAALRAEGSFAVNLLHQGGAHTAGVFASAVPDRFARTAWRRSSRLGLPWLHEDAYAVAECRVVESVEIGDHMAVFGEVVGVENGAGWPLLYGRRAFRSVDRAGAVDGVRAEANVS